MKIKTILILLMIAGLFACQRPDYSNSWKNLNYAGDTLGSHMLDVYLPRETKSYYPAVLIIYGSAFFGDDLKERAYEVYGKPLLDAGFAVAAMNHRSSRDAIYPAQIQDVKAALRFLRARGSGFLIDTSFIGITGYSSGGHLAALAGTSGTVSSMTIGEESVQIEGSLGDYDTYSSSVDAVVDWFGPVDFLTMDSCGSSMVHNAPDSPESILLGGPILENRELCALANPMSYVDAEDPPFLLLHGDQDPLVPVCQSEALHHALQNEGVRSEFVRIRGGQHGPGVFKKKYFLKMCDFFLYEYEMKGKKL